MAYLVITHRGAFQLANPASASVFEKRLWPAVSRDALNWTHDKQYLYLSFWKGGRHLEFQCSLSAHARAKMQAKRCHSFPS
jgi:hypothetical protein